VLALICFFTCLWIFGDPLSSAQSNSSYSEANLDSNYDQPKPYQMNPPPPGGPGS
jgi:hypothetical protein